jgi:glycosyltransferase involved in cell wall biosynthesis
MTGTTTAPTGKTRNDGGAAAAKLSRPPMRVAINLLTEDPRNPSGAHWFWTRVIPEMAKRLETNEELHLIVSPSSKPKYQGYGANVHYITYPWSNERRALRTASEHLYSPVRLPLNHIDVLNTLIAPVWNPAWSLVLHMKTMHAFTTPQAVSPAVRAYRRFGYPRSTRLADAIIINSESLRAEINKHLDVDPSKLKLIYEAVDHDLFKPGDAAAARAHVATFGVTKPFALFVSSLWPYKNCDGLLRAWALVRDQMGDRQLVIVGPERDERYGAELHRMVQELGIGADVVFAGGVPLDQTAIFYNAADVLVYPSRNETFGLPILEAMACGCPVVTSDVSAMPETAGGAALLCDPEDPASIGKAMVEAVGPAATALRQGGLRRAHEFTWAATGAATLDVYREVADRRRHRALKDRPLQPTTDEGR